MKRMIRVLQFPVDNIRNGVTQYALSNWKFIDKAKFQFDFATMNKHLNYESELVTQGCKVYYLSCYAEDNKEQFIKEMNHILEQGYEVIHLHTVSWKSFLVEQLAREKKIPVIIVHSHNTGINIENNVEREKAMAHHDKLKKLFTADLATNFCACSYAAADWLFGEQIPRERIQILKNAVDTEQFSYKPKVRDCYRKELGLEDCFVLGHVGRFDYVKNHKMLLHIFKEVFDRNSRARLLLVGDGILMNEIHQQAREYELEDKILFLGERKDTANLLQAMDVFVFPSRSEGLGLSLIEAQSVGLPCITSEYVPCEVCLTPNIKILPYKVSKWVEEILNISRGYERKDRSESVANAGYSLTEQIRLVEDLYSFAYAVAK